MKKIMILVFCIFAITININAQSKIQGIVFDKSTHKILPFVNIYIPEQHKGTLSDLNGAFLLKNLHKGKLQIQFSFVGYETIIKTLLLNNKDTLLKIEMKPTVLQTEEVVVSGGAYATEHDNAIKIVMLKTKDLVTVGTPTFMEALAQTPGIDMISKGAGVAKPVIRGLSMTNILMLNNGFKMENFQFSENHPFIVDEFGLDRIEIVKGPASLLYGSDAVGGVINIVKEKPAPIGKVLGDYHLQYHSNTQGVVSNIGIKGRSDNLFWGFRAGVKSHTDYRDGNNQYVPNTRFNEQSIKAQLGYSKSFGLFRLYYDYNRPRLGLCIPPAIAITKEYGRNNKYWYQDLSNHIIASKNTLFLNKYKIELNTAFQSNHRELKTDSQQKYFEIVDMQMNTFSYEIKTYLPSTKRSEYIIGLQGAKKINRNYDAPNHIIPNALVNDASAFGFVQYTFAGVLKTQAGLRYDYRNIETEAEWNKKAINTKYGDLSGSIGGTYDLNEKILLRMNLASAFRTPNIAELTENGMHGSRYEQGNENLVSQRNYEADLSMHYHLKYFMIDISTFYNKINNYIYISPTKDTSNNGYYIYRYEQNNAAIYGTELSAQFNPWKFLDVYTSYAYLIGKQENGSALPFIPQNKWRWEIKYHKNKMKFLHQSFLKLSGVYADKQNRPALFETESDSYFLFNMGIGTNLKWGKQKIILSVQVNNIFNVNYIDHLSTLKPLGYYNMGRNISVNLSIPFEIYSKPYVEK